MIRESLCVCCGHVVRYVHAVDYIRITISRPLDQHATSRTNQALFGRTGSTHCWRPLSVTIRECERIYIL